MSKLQHLSQTDNWYFVTTTLRKPLSLFSHHSNADIVLEIIEKRITDGAFELDEFVVMPDHIHLIVIPKLKQLPEIVKEIKRGSARLINIREKIRTRSIWLDEYHDELIRSERELYNKRMYIRFNPVKAGLAVVQEDYLFSSANPVIRKRFSMS